MSQKPARALYMPRGKDDCLPSKHRFPSDTRTITTGDIWRMTKRNIHNRYKPVSSELKHYIKLCYRWIVNDRAATTHSLTPCLVAAGWLARGAAEAAGLMPSQQSLTLQDKTLARKK